MKIKSLLTSSFITSSSIYISYEQALEKLKTNNKSAIKNFIAEIMNMHVQTDLSSSSSRVTPVVDEGVVDVECSGGPRHATEHSPEDAWLPVTESRKGNTFTATVHLLCSGIGFQALLLPIAFVSLGWTWGIICFSVAYLWQLYTIWLLVNLHESSPQPGVRYSRFLQLSIIAFGPKLGKLLAIFPVLYLSSGACIFYINAGGNAMRTFYRLVCESSSNCNSDALSGVEWFLIFACMAILIAQFYPNLNSLALVMLIGSVTAIAFCTVLWISITVNHNELASVSDVVKENSTSTAASFRDVMNGIAVIVFAFRGHNLVLEIQGTMPTNYKVRSNKPMWRGVTISYILIAVCLYPLAVVGHWAYGNTVTSEGGLLSAFTNNHTSKYIIGTVQLIIIINYLCTFQIYAMVSFDNLERIYVSKNNGPCPKWIRSIIKILFGGVLYFVAVALPFMPRLATLFGSIAMLVTFVYPCFMWLSIKKPLRLSGMWWLNMGLGSAGLVLCVLIFISAVWTLVVNHFHANFFNP